MLYGDSCAACNATGSLNLDFGEDAKNWANLLPALGVEDRCGALSFKISKGSLIGGLLLANGFIVRVGIASQPFSVGCR